MQMFQYFIKVVPTDFIYLNGTVLKTNQFSFTENSLESAVRQASLPGTGTMTNGRTKSKKGDGSTDDAQNAVSLRPSDRRVLQL